MRLPTEREEVCRVLDWDSKFFGFKVGRVKLSRLSRAAMPALLEWCARQRVRCLYLLADADHAETSRLATEHGFCLVDIRITLERLLPPDAEASAGRRPAGIRAFRSGDLPALRNLAGDLHQDTRFFFDARFPPAQSRELYRVWMEQSCLNPHSQVFVLPSEDGVAGYIACSAGEDRTGKIELLGVGPKTQGRGSGGKLVDAGLRWFAAEGLRHVTVVTQGRNIRAQRVYQRAGFVTQSVQLWYHLWLGRQAKVPGKVRE
jgi:dTDP-4-amino-4,6-dideoxy-D-galactose acyltransferase